jgi:hypothetical protein
VVDIVAEDDDDLLLWKGWVQSRLRQLTLKVLFRNFVFGTDICSAVWLCLILHCKKNNLSF